jgi:uncharacterized protein (DUF427 family)
MGVRLRDALMGRLDQLRYEPTGKRVRAVLDGQTVVDSTRAMLIWEPRRIVPSYAVPEQDVTGELAPAQVAGGTVDDSVGHRLPDLSARPVLDPSIPFAAHTAEGRPTDVRVGSARHQGLAFALADSDLAGYVELDFAGFEAWYEEDERIVAHPRDPFHRIDVLRSSRHVRIELDGHLLAESTRPRLLFETSLPARYYLPPEDVRAQLRPSATLTHCAYKGQASYWSIDLGGTVVPDLGWTYRNPLHDAADVAGMVAFFNERVDLVIDGARQERPQTPWSPPQR